MELNYELPNEVTEMILANATANDSKKGNVNWELDNAWADYMEE